MKPEQKSRKRMASSSTLTTRQVTSVARTVAATLAFNLKAHDETKRTAELDAAQNLFTVFMKRFDTVDADNTEIKKALSNHIIDDNKVHDIVQQHKTYWGIAIKSLMGLLAGGFTLLMAWLKWK